MTAAIDLMQQYPLLTLAYLFVLGGSIADAIERRRWEESE